MSGVRFANDFPKRRPSPSSIEVASDLACGRLFRRCRLIQQYRSRPIRNKPHRPPNTAASTSSVVQIAPTCVICEKNKMSTRWRASGVFILTFLDRSKLVDESHGQTRHDAMMDWVSRSWTMAGWNLNHLMVICLFCDYALTTRLSCSIFLRCIRPSI